MYKKKSLNYLSSLLYTIIFLGVVLFSSLKSQTASAQYWAAIPPYNTLWPLWSSVFSPVSRSTGLPTPIVTSLVPTTKLSVQPALTWSPFMNYPWLLYNTPSGMAYYDPIKGINLWPPSILVNIFTGLPITLTLPAGYEYLTGPPSLLTWLLQTVPSANTFYQISYPNFVPINLRSSVTPPPVLPATSLLAGISALTPII